MFAFALWDRKQQLLFCARDRLGKKPLYYTVVAGRFVFASELAALAALPGVSRRVRPQAVDDFFAFGYVPEPGSIFQDVYKLPAASTLLLDRSGRPARVTRYWQPTRLAAPCTAEDAVLQLQAHLRDAVACRLVSDVPLGAFLSGGVDSSAVVASAAPMLDHPLDTFTIGFEGAEDETPYAAMVAERYGTRQAQRPCRRNRHDRGRPHPGCRVRRTVRDSSSVPTLTVCRLARRHATVAISGDGGDEVFGGYRRYRWHRLVSGVRDHLPAGVRRHAIGRLAAIYPKLDRAPRFLRANTR